MAREIWAYNGEDSQDLDVPASLLLEERGLVGLDVEVRIELFYNSISFWRTK